MEKMLRIGDGVGTKFSPGDRSLSGPPFYSLDIKKKKRANEIISFTRHTQFHYPARSNFI